ncbi:hypothetical protein N7475_006917 [Penicillium sp. IBT 31633x]|nr:hypothetical protein N7475_006917 [Penicillium sp. IBT 31633x]
MSSLAKLGSIEHLQARILTWALDFALNGTRLGLGETVTRKRYADTLEAIAEQGPDAFYAGPIAEIMIDAI